MNTSSISSLGWMQAGINVDDRIPAKTLTQQDFLKLLVTQLTNQDPLNPQKDLEFISQMVQFSVLEQNKAMQTTIANMENSQQVVQANSIIGRQVELMNPDLSPVIGTVESVVFVSGIPFVVVNGKPYSLDSITRISIPQNNANQQQ